MHSEQAKHARLSDLSDGGVSWLFQPIENLELTVRAFNALLSAGVRYVGDIVVKSEADLLCCQNLGVKSLRDIELALQGVGLRLRVDLPNWPPQVLQEADARTFQRLPVANLRALLGGDDRGDFHVDLESSTPPETEPALPDLVRVQLIRTIHELGLSLRSMNVLTNLKLKYVGDVAQMTESDLLRQLNFGHRSLDEVKAALAKVGLRLGTTIPGWNHDLARGWLEQFRTELAQVREQEDVSAIREIEPRAAFLEDELTALAVAKVGARRAKIVTELFGWNGTAPTTLEAVGHTYGITRERVRQIAKKLTTQLAERSIYLPVLTSALTLIEQNCPARAADLETLLVTRNLTRRPFPMEALIKVAQTVGRHLDLSIMEVNCIRVVGPQASLKHASKVPRRARAMVSRFGCASVAEVAAGPSVGDGWPVSHEVARLFIEMLHDLRWLDETKSWFWLASNGRNRIINIVRKILAVTPQVQIGELRFAVQRVHRMQGFAPPRKILLSLCQQLPLCRVNGDVISPAVPLDPSKELGQTELILWKVFAESGPALQSEELERACLKHGMNSNTFYQYLTYSPIIAHLARNVYSLVGANITPDIVQSLVATEQKHKIVHDYGWTTNGEAWIHYQLSRAVIRMGALTVPAAMNGLLEGGYTLIAADGEAFGQVTVSSGRLSGLREFFARRGAEEDDTVVLRFDQSRHVAIFETGDESLTEPRART